MYILDFLFQVFFFLPNTTFLFILDVRFACYTIMLELSVDLKVHEFQTKFS